MTGLVYVAADIYGQKVNLQVEGAKVPSLPELYQTIQQLFSNECYVLRPPGTTQQLFSIEKVQIYSDEGKESGQPVGWKDLVSSSQLVPRAQLYVFQSDPTIEESQQKISRHLSRKPSLLVAPSSDAASRSVSGAQRISTPQSSGAYVAPATPTTLDSQTKLRGYGDYYPASLPSPLTGTARNNDVLGSEVSPIRFRSAATGAVAASSITPRAYRSKMTTSAAVDAMINQPSRTASTSTFSSPLPLVQSSLLTSGRSLTHSSATTSQQISDLKGVVTSKHPGEHASPAEKHRYLYNLITATFGTREVELDNLRTFLEDHHFGMASTIALADLFARCDADNNGRLNNAELSALFTMLPTLMDSLYFRLLDSEDYAQLIAQLQREQHQLDAILTSQSSLVSHVEQFHRDIETQANNMSRLAEASEETLLQVNDRRESIHLMEQECERLRLEKEACTDDAKRQAAIIDQTKAAHAETRRKAEQAEAFARQSQLKLTSCEERVKELQRMLARVQEECAEQLQFVESSARDAANLRQQETDLSQREKELLQGLSVRRDRAQELDIHVQRRRQQATEHRDVVQRLEREMQEHSAHKVAEEHKLQRMHHSEKEASQQLSRVVESIEHQEGKLRALEEKIQQFNERRMAMEQKERPLLEQELMLRSHRDALDQQEQRLKREVGSLFYGIAE
jgi:hypothetical protein